MGPIDVTQLGTGLSVLAGAVLLKSMMDQKPTMGPTQFRRCPSCNGSGRVACLCSRWSDGDVGCRTCAGSGRMACSSCGGTGTGRPIPAPISVRRPPSIKTGKDSGRVLSIDRNNDVWDHGDGRRSLFNKCT